MPVFAYRAVTDEGKRTRGRLSAASEEAAVRDLEIKGLLPLDLREDGAAVSKTAGGKTRRAVLEFTRGMAALLPAGMPLSRAMAASASTTPQSIQGVLADVMERVQRGEQLGASMGHHPEVFTPLYVGIVRAGEKSGALDPAFVRLAEHLEREEELRAKLLSMAIYPVVLAVVGIASILVLVLFVLPRFAVVLEGSGSPLPRSTAMVLAVASAIREAWVGLALAPVALGALLSWMRRAEGGRRLASRLLLAAPAIGTWRRQALAAQFARMSGELLQGGSPVLASLRDTGECMNDPIAAEAVKRVRTRVREGSPFNEAISDEDLFPDELWQLVALGEEAGRLSEFLLKAAELLERRTERALERVVALAEPAVIIAFGGVVALVALSLLQAIYGVNPAALS